MKFELEEYHRGVTDQDLLADLQQVARERGKIALTRAEYDEHGKYSSTTCVRRFGSWFGGLESAGLQKTRTPMNLPVEELFQNLEEIWVRLGRQPRYGEIRKPHSKYSAKIYENRFGTWRKALEEFVTYVNSDEIAPTESKVTPFEAEQLDKHKTKRTVSWRLRFIVMRRDSFRCRSCGRSPATDLSVILHVDHVKAWANGGETYLKICRLFVRNATSGRAISSDAVLVDVSASHLSDMTPPHFAY